MGTKDKCLVYAKCSKIGWQIGDDHNHEANTFIYCMLCEKENFSFTKSYFELEEKYEAIKLQSENYQSVSQ